MTYVFSTKYAGQISIYTLFTQLIMNQYIFIHIQLFSEGFHLLSLEPITQLINPSFKPGTYIGTWRTTARARRGVAPVTTGAAVAVPAVATYLLGITPISDGI